MTYPYFLDGVLPPYATGLLRGRVSSKRTKFYVVEYIWLQKKMVYTFINLN